MLQLKELGRIKSATLYWRPEVKLRREMGYSRALGQNRHQRFVTYLDMLGEKELKERLQSSRSHRELEGKEAAPSLFIGVRVLVGEGRGRPTMLTPLVDGPRNKGCRACSTL